MRILGRIIVIFPMVFLSSCTPLPSADQSREVLWARFGNQPVDALLMSWGTPMGETHLTDGSRMISYQHATFYNAGSPYEQHSACKVSFLAASPSFAITNTALEGDSSDCHQLAQGRIGNSIVPYVPPVYTPYHEPYRRYPF